MQTDYLREFIDLSDTLNFTQSAKRLNVSQPTLSRHISALEKEVGTPLFDRSFDAVRLTRAGAAFYDDARAILSNLDNMVERADHVSQEKVVTLKIGGSTIQPIVARFISRMTTLAATEHLPVRFEYSHTRSISNELLPPLGVDLLGAEEIDLLVDHYPKFDEMPARLTSIKLFTEPLSFFVSKDNPLAEQKDLKLTDLSDETYVLFSLYQHAPSFFEGIIRSNGCSPDKIHTVLIGDILEIPEYLVQLRPNEFSTLQSGLATTYGFGDDSSGRIRKLDVQDPQAVETYCLTWRKSDNRSAIDTAVELARKVKESFVDNSAFD